MKEIKDIENRLLEFSMNYAVKFVSCYYSSHYKIGLKSLSGDNYLWIIEQKIKGCYIISYKFDMEKGSKVCFIGGQGDCSLKNQLDKVLSKASEYFDIVDSLNKLVYKEKDILYSEYGEYMIRKDSGEYEDYL